MTAPLAGMPAWQPAATNPTVSPPRLGSPPSLPPCAQVLAGKGAPGHRLLVDLDAIKEKPGLSSKVDIGEIVPSSVCLRSPSAGRCCCRRRWRAAAAVDAAVDVPLLRLLLPSRLPLPPCFCCVHCRRLPTTWQAFPTAQLGSAAVHPCCQPSQNSTPRATAGSPGMPACPQPAGPEASRSLCLPCLCPRVCFPAPCPLSRVPAPAPPRRRPQASSPPLRPRCRRCWTA